MRIFHIATAADWQAARCSGAYTTSTIGRTLEQEGIIHASRLEQVHPTWQRFYRDVREPLVLLTIDTGRLEVEWREDPVRDDTYPHLYGPLSPGAVVAVQPLDHDGATAGFTTLFAREMGVRAGLVLAAMLLAGLGSWVGERVEADWGRFVGALVGLATGLGLMGAVLRRRR